MLRQLLGQGVLALGLLTVTTLVLRTSALAQPPGGQVGRNPISRPTTSPYLNLLNNRGGSPTLNYFNLVRPEQQFRQAATQFSGELNSLRGNLNQLQNQQPQAGESPAPLAPGRMAPTGHTATFNNLGGFFPSSPGTPGGMGQPRR
jgi:hypothetical protein